MKKRIILFIMAAFLFSGCATYKFQQGKVPYDKGYVASRDSRVIPEYTIGRDNGVPELPLAKERFKRRRGMVEHYYKKMGYIENHFKMACWDPCVYFVKLFAGVFRLPFIAVADYKYEHNAAYKDRIRKIEDEKDAREEARINKLKGNLNNYIQQDLTKEQ